MKLERNGIDLSLDYNLVSVVDKVEQANKRYLQKHQPPPAGLSTAEAILHQTREIMVAINEIYAETHGADVCGQIFDMKQLDYNAVADLYLAIVSGIGDAREQQALLRLENARKNNERLKRIQATQAETTTLEAENAALVPAGAPAPPEPKRDTLVPFSDMSGRPRVPLAVPMPAGQSQWE